MGLTDKIRTQILAGCEPETYAEIRREQEALTRHEVKLDTERTCGSGETIVHLNCPICGCQETHIHGHTKVNESGPVRGEVLHIRGECEHGCLFDLCLGQHKGDTYVWAEDKGNNANAKHSEAFEEGRALGFREALISVGGAPPTPKES